MKKILVTGGAGFLGSHVVAALKEQGREVVVVDAEIKNKKFFYTDGVEYVKDRMNDGALLARVRGGEFGEVVHLAAQTSVTSSVADPVGDARTNVLEALELLEAARAGGVEYVVFSSSGGAIYGDAAVVPTPHTEDAFPLSPYGVAKLAFERYLQAYFLLHGLKSASLRYANLYGPHQVLEEPMGDGGVVPIFLERMMKTGQEVKIFGDGKQTRDFLYVADAVEAILLSLDKRPHGSWNIGTGEETSVNALWAALLEAHGREHAMSYAPARNGEVLRSALESSGAEQAFGWRAKTSLKDGLRLTYDWYAS